MPIVFSLENHPLTTGGVKFHLKLGVGPGWPDMGGIKLGRMYHPYFTKLNLHYIHLIHRIQGERRTAVPESGQGEAVTRSISSSGRLVCSH